MEKLELYGLLNPMMLAVMAASLFVFFFYSWKKQKDREHYLRLRELNLKEKEIEESSARGNSIHIENAANQQADLGGYITLDIPEERKSLFHDLLKGFEDYAAVKGYKVNVAIDSSVNGKISFKIVVDDFGIVGSKESVKRDLNEFINKVQNGESLDDLESMATDMEQTKLFLALRNRISVLQSQFEVHKHLNDFYKSFVEQLPSQSISYTPPINIYNGGHEMDQRKYISNNSANVMQGDNHSNLIENNNINIGSTFAEKSDQVAGLDELISLLKASDSQEKDKTVRHLENVREELTEEAEPDAGNIEKFLNKAASTLQAFDKGSEIFSKAKDVMKGFGLDF